MTALGLGGLGRRPITVSVFPNFHPAQVAWGVGRGDHLETVPHQRAGDRLPVQVGPDGARLMVLHPEDAAQQPNLREGQALSVDRGVEPNRESQIK